MDENLYRWGLLLERKLNILVSSSIFPNGEEKTKGIYIFHQAKALSKYCRVKVIAPVPYFPSWIKSSSYHLYSKIKKKENIDGLDVLHPRVIVIPKIGRSLYGMLYALSLYRIMRHMKGSFNPDLILCYWAYPDGFANVLLARMLNIPVITGGRGCDINDAAAYRSKRVMVSWTLRKSDRVFAVSEAMKSEMIKLGCDSDRIKVIPNGLHGMFISIDKEKAQEITGINIKGYIGRVILFCGRLSPEKGLDYLLRAAGLLKRKGIDYLLLLVGNGPENNRLQSLTSDLDLNNHVRFIGELDYQKIPALMSLADIFCLPSIREGWPNVVVEALGCGVPVVASRVGGVPEILTSPDYGTMVSAQDIVSLGDALYSALGRVWDKEKVVEAVRKRSWDNVAQEIFDEAMDIVEK